MKKNRIHPQLLLLPLLFLLFNVQLFAQTRTVTGKVTDKTNVGLPGVSVQVKGTNTGTVTDAGGNFSIVVPTNAVLEFSYSGLGSKELTVRDQATIDVQLDDKNTT